MTHQDAGVQPHRHKERAQRQVVVCLGFVHAQDAGCLAGFQDPFDTVFNHSLYFRMPRVAHMAERGRQIRRADENAVNTVDGGNGVQVVNGSAGFGLHQQADGRVRLFGVVGITPPA